MFCAVFAVNSAVAQQPAVLLGPDLEPTSVQLQALWPDAIEVIDRRGETKTLTPDAVLRLTLSRRATATPGAGSAVVTLRDGQVLVGKLAASDDEEAVRLEMDRGPAVQVPLDEMLSLVIDAGASVPVADEDDALLLATGEVLLGFVETFSQDAIGFVVGDRDDAIQIPMQRVKAVAIANKPRQTQAKAGTVRVTTVDGSAILLAEATLRSLDSGDVLVGVTALPVVSSQAIGDDAPAGPASRLSLAMSRVVTIEPISERVRLTALSDHAMRVRSGGQVFGVAMPPRRTESGDLRLHAPVAVGFDLPIGASRLALTVAMDLDDTIDESRRAMAGCVLVVYLGDDAIGEHTLTPDGAPKRLNFPLTGRDLRLVLNPGVNGPVLDRVRITEAQVLVSD